jgi:DNA repair exonuclease SbcCD ATPase subunit
MPKKSSIDTDSSVEQLVEQIAELHEKIADLSEKFTNLSLTTIVNNEREILDTRSKDLDLEITTQTSLLQDLRDKQTAFDNKDDEITAIKEDLKKIERFLRGKDPEEMRDYFDRQNKLNKDLKALQRLKDVSVEIKEAEETLDKLKKENTDVTKRFKIVSKAISILELSDIDE